MSAENEASHLAAEPETETPEAWAIGNLTDLDWSFSRLADLEREQEENTALAAAAIARAKARAEHLNERLEKGAQFFRDRIRAYAEAHRAELLGGGKKKSRALLHGVVSWRKTGGNLEVLDKAALLAWALAQPVEAGFVRSKEEAAVDEIKRAFKLTGEVPPGCELRPEGEELKLEAIMGGNANEH